jgi:peptide/nickel transport system permease protein
MTAGTIEVRDFTAGRWRRRAQRLWGVVRRFSHQTSGVIGVGIIAVFVVFALIPELFAGPFQSVTMATGPKFASPNGTFIFGTDELGRDIFNLVVHGSRISMFIGLLATVITVLIGAVVGIVSGFVGGRVDTLLMRITDFFLILPTFVLALVLAPILRELLGEGSEVFGIRVTLITIVIVIGLTSWASTARIVRSQTLSIRERTFMDRARAYGASNARLMTRHVFPNVFALILANATLTVAAAIFLETTLSFLGVGDKTTWSWGRILEDAFNAGALTLGKFLWFVPPGLGVVLVVLAFTLVGQAFDEVLNPRLRAREAGTFEAIVELSYEVPPTPGTTPPAPAAPSGG